MNQPLTVIKAAGSDGWGRQLPGEKIEYKVYAQETTEVVTNQAGKEAVASLKIIFDKRPNLTYDDTIVYKDEMGVEIKRRPVKIEPKRLPGAKKIWLTVVYV